jgi:hypothetical protein
MVDEPSQPASGGELKVLLKADLGPEVDEAAAAALLQSLRRQILGLDVDGADFVPLPPGPAGAKGAGVDWQALLLTLSGAGGVLTSVLATVQTWLSHDEHRTMTIEIGGDKLTVSGVSSADQKRLIDSWVKRQRKE